MDKKTKKPPNVFETLRLDAGLKRPAMAKLLNTSQQQIYHLERRNSKITTEWLDRYTKALNINTPLVTQYKETINIDQLSPIGLASHTVPVYGMAAAGDSELVVLNENSIVEHVAYSPPTGSSMPADAFGVVVRGDSMSPRFQPNEIVIVNPHIMPRKHEECLVEMTDGTALVKIFERREANRYILSQYNHELCDGRATEVDVLSVKRLCAIIGHIIRR
jgi:phage repressor protein C with HTH and peptisase S24 domain